MTYEILILRRAQKELARLPQKDYQKIRDAIYNLVSNPRLSGCKKLIGNNL